MEYNFDMTLTPASSIHSKVNILKIVLLVQVVDIYLCVFKTFPTGVGGSCTSLLPNLESLHTSYPEIQVEVAEWNLLCM